MVGGWAGALAGGDGINVVAGTGSIAYGERQGRAHRAGGWSELFGDEGSAYWVAVQGLNAFSRMSDGRLPRGPLHALLAERVGITEDLDLVGVVVDRGAGGGPRSPGCPRPWSRPADAGDTEAGAILRRAGQELVGLVEACRDQLGYQDGEHVAVSYSGGMFSAPSFRTTFSRALRAAGSGYRLCTPLYGPAVGSALYAMKLHGAELPPPPSGSAPNLEGEVIDV